MCVYPVPELSYQGGLLLHLLASDFVSLYFLLQHIRVLQL